MIKAEIVADSKNEFGNRITTMVVTFPRIILAEFNTHRMFSRNSASSRAIPFEKMVESVKNNPFIPIAWQADHKGMQGTEYVLDRDAEVSKSAWLVARDRAITQAEHLRERNVTKQLANRLLEPFMYHTCIVTATEWENFFALRCPKYTLDTITTKEFRSRKDYSNYVTDNGAMTDITRTELDWLKLNKGQAEIHMMALAEAMWNAYNESIPKELKAREWHIPFGDTIDEKVLWGNAQQRYDKFNSQPQYDFNIEVKEDTIKVATAHCARVSYTIIGDTDKDSKYDRDIQLHDNLLKAGHMSPFEHCARAMDDREIQLYKLQQGATNDINILNRELGWCGNFRGFIQYRKMIPDENIR